MLRIGGGRMKCEICMNEVVTALDKHHAVPVSEGGKRARWNVVYLCANCHRLVHRWMKLERKLKESEYLRQGARSPAGHGTCDMCGKWASERSRIGLGKGPKEQAGNAIHLCRDCDAFVRDWRVLGEARKKRAELAEKLTQVGELRFKDDTWCCRCVDTHAGEYYEIEISYFQGEAGGAVGRTVDTVVLCPECVEKLELWLTGGDRDATAYPPSHGEGGDSRTLRLP